MNTHGFPPEKFREWVRLGLVQEADVGPKPGLPKSTRAPIDLGLALSRTLTLCGLRHETEFGGWHPLREWRFDVAFPLQKVAVEADGGLFLKGRRSHGGAKGIEADNERDAEAMILGWAVLRVTGKMIHDGRAVNLIARLLAARATNHEGKYGG